MKGHVWHTKRGVFHTLVVCSTVVVRFRSTAALSALLDDEKEFETLSPFSREAPQRHRFLLLTNVSLPQLPPSLFRLCIHPLRVCLHAQDPNTATQTRSRDRKRARFSPTAAATAFSTVADAAATASSTTAAAPRPASFSRPRTFSKLIFPPSDRLFPEHPVAFDAPLTSPAHLGLRPTSGGDGGSEKKNSSKGKPRPLTGKVKPRSPAAKGKPAAGQGQGKTAGFMGDSKRVAEKERPAVGKKIAAAGHGNPAADGGKAAAPKTKPSSGPSGGKAAGGSGEPNPEARQGSLAGGQGMSPRFVLCFQVVVRKTQDAEHLPTLPLLACVGGLAWPVGPFVACLYTRHMSARLPPSTT